MLKITNVTFAFLLLAISWQAVQAQAPMSNYDYYIMRQQIVGSAAANQSNARAAETAQIQAIGEKRIKAGKGSMSFTPTQAGLESFTKDMTFEPHEPQTFPEQVILIKNYVKRFNQMLTAARGKTNNCADAYALAYATSYMY